MRARHSFHIVSGGFVELLALCTIRNRPRATTNESNKFIGGKAGGNCERFIFGTKGGERFSERA